MEEICTLCSSVASPAFIDLLVCQPCLNIETEMDAFIGRLVSLTVFQVRGDTSVAYLLFTVCSNCAV